MDFLIWSSILDLFWPMKTPKSENVRKPAPPLPQIKTDKAHDQMERTSDNASAAARDSRVREAQQLMTCFSALHWSFLLAH